MDQMVSSRGFGNDEEISFDIVASQAGNGSYHAAESVSRTVKVKKPSKSVFFEERKADSGMKQSRMLQLTGLRQKMGISGEKAIALFNSDNYDSDGDGVSNLLERAFGGDSLSNDNDDSRPKPVKKNDNYERIVFNRYNSTYQADMGITYIVEESSDLRPGTLSVLLQKAQMISGAVWKEWFTEPPAKTTSGNTVHPGKS